jgi:hypothetical protein
VPESAIANAENNHDLDVDRWSCGSFVGKSIVMKRFHARGRGRGARILKPFSHLTIVVREVEAGQEEESIMGQKINPIGLPPWHQPHLGFSRWFAEGRVRQLLHEDLKIRKFVMKR